MEMGNVNEKRRKRKCQAKNVSYNIKNNGNSIDEKNKLSQSVVEH